MSGKLQPELEGFEREVVPEVDSAIAALREAEADLKRAKARRDAMRERLDFELVERQLSAYLFEDGDWALEIKRSESVSLSMRVVRRPKPATEDGVE